MKLAVMQPYFLPYLGYFQLMAAVDSFVLYDDVTFIKRGWINRNRILMKRGEHRFALPVRRASQNRLINELELVDSDWPEKLLQTFRHAYRRAPCFDEIFPLLEKIVNYGDRQLVAYLRHGLAAIQSYLKIETRIVPTSATYHNQHLKGQARILDICRQVKATDYFNAGGGVELYDSASFSAHGIRLHLLDSVIPRYEQFGQSFVPRLSIVDVLMFNSRKRVQSWVSTPPGSP